MSDQIRFDYELDDYKEYKSLVIKEGKTVKQDLTDYIQNKLRKTEVRTTSNYNDQFVKELQSYDLSNVIKTKYIHLELNCKEHYYFIESAGQNLLSELRKAVVYALKEYTIKQLAKLKSIIYPSIEFEQFSSLESFKVEKWIRFERWCLTKIKITYSTPCVTQKPLSDFQKDDLGSVLQTNVSIIGMSRRKFDTLLEDYVQQIQIQELESDAKNNNPLSLKATIFGKKEFGIGERKKLIGLYRIEEPQNGKASTSLMNLHFDVFDLKNPDEEKEYVLTNQELLTVKEFASKSKDEYLQKLTVSFAPHIHGRFLEKLGLLLSILGGSNIRNFRKESHLLLVGEPSTGKSELLKFANKITQKSSMIDGANATSKGILFGMDEIEGQKVVKAGPMVLNSGGHLLIDEYDKMRSSDQKALNVAMEQQQAKYNTAGHNIVADAKTTVIAACNPQMGRWNDTISIVDNIGLDPTSLSRFDIIIRLAHENNEHQLRSQIKHILANTKSETSEILSPYYLKGLFNYLRKQNPQLTPEAEQTIEEFYVAFQKLQQKDGSIPFEPRQMVGIIRLATSFAKLLFKKEVDVETVQQAIEFYKHTLRTLGMITEVEMQLDLRGYSINKDQFFCEIFMGIAKDNEGGYVEIQSLTEKLLENPKFFRTERSVNDYLKAKKNEGYCYEPHNGRWKRQ